MGRVPTVGPVIDEASARRIEAWVGEARQASAEILVGGQRDKAMVTPTFLVGTAKGMKVEDEEIFGPVLTVDSLDTFGDAVRRAFTAIED
ncbi:MAG: aldehyde dehydrogenase family protein [Reyranella sp.]|nr:aldehyde dehydrogenase family protein [Reyranella sp.]